MKLLFDENLSPRLAAEPSAGLPGSAHVHDVGLGATADSAVWDYARNDGFVIVSKDRRTRQAQKGPERGQGQFQAQKGARVSFKLARLSQPTVAFLRFRVLSAAKCLSHLKASVGHACREDPERCRQGVGCLHCASCSCAARDARRTAGSTSTARSCRTDGWPTLRGAAPRAVSGEINASQREAWRNTIEVCDARGTRRQMALFSAGTVPCDDIDAIGVRLSELRLQRPRQWGACWLALQLWRERDLDAFWYERLPASREGTPWLTVLKTLVAYG